MNKKGKFVSGERILFPAKASKRAVEVIIPPALANQFDVIEKDMPEELPLSWNLYQLVWINNIGLMKKIADAKVAAGEYYEVQFEKGSLPGDEMILVYWNGSRVIEFPHSSYLEAGEGKLALRLKLIDPPIGIGAR